MLDEGRYYFLSRPLRDKHYADKDRQKGKQMVLSGINFSTETRNVTEWKIT
jgi:hypothetical protein